MRLLLLVLLSLRCMFGDVCDRMSALQHDFADSILVLQKPYCDHRDICVGIVSRTSGMEISCKNIFHLLMSHQARFVDEPPILMPLRTSFREIQRDYNEFMTSKDAGRENDDSLSTISENSRRLLRVMEVSVLEIVKHVQLLFPRIYYDDSVAGIDLRIFHRALNELFEEIPEHHPNALAITKYIYRSFWMGKWSSVITMMLKHLATLPMNEMEPMLVSYAPTIHSFLRTCSELNFVYSGHFQGYLWVLTSLVKYDPLYSPESRVWVIPRPLTLVSTSSPVVPIDLQMDMDFLYQLLWQHPQCPEEFSKSLLTSIEEQDIDEMRKLAVVARYIGESNIRVQLTLEQKAVIETMLGNDTRHRDFVDSFTLFTLVSIFKNQLSPNFEASIFGIPYSGYKKSEHMKTLKIVYGFSGPSIEGFINQIMQLDKFDFFACATLFWRIDAPDSCLVGIPQTSDQLQQDLLKAFFDSDMFISEWSFDHADETAVGRPVYQLRYTSPDRDRRLQTALGRLIGLSLRSPGSLRKNLLSYIVAESPESTIFETMFFSSYYIRNGVYDVIPFGLVEHRFANAAQLIRALENS